MISISKFLKSLICPLESVQAKRWWQMDKCLTERPSQTRSWVVVSQRVGAGGKLGLRPEFEGRAKRVLWVDYVPFPKSIC